MAVVSVTLSYKLSLIGKSRVKLILHQSFYTLSSLLELREVCIERGRVTMLRCLMRLILV